MTVAHELPVLAPGDATSGRGQDGYDHLDPLLEEFAGLEQNDPRRLVLRDQLVSGFLPVVEHIARRYRGRGEPVADLEQVGMIGLLNALDRFEPERGVNFLGYLIPIVTGEIRRYFRDRTWSMRVPRRLKDLQGPIREAVASLSHEHRRAPRPSEIADRLGIDTEDVIEGLRAQDVYTAASLDALVAGAGPALHGTLGRADAALEEVEYRHALRLLLDELPDRERKMLVLRFFGELTQTEIASQMGISQMHVSRLLSRTLAALRRGLEAE
ncbi:SigB/SigF/SigG family RNA polymerase sigma factor [Pseudonocardia nigra]|uniref:SigB/SigF/SigG family RNA polymerase sigma factor n=1 Tax=Pseudonocardia nigra TaxID=1921578 RepID=UPI001C5F6388|nr:SigB/SigF/SigG family RNA polymerase sigma factor [Pseudonocardia nigra]